MTAAPRPEADVCLIVEGAYPYVVGGVSAWLGDLIAHLPDLTFAIVAIKPGAAPVEHRVTLPPNVIELVEVGLAPEPETPRPCPDRVAAAIGRALVRIIAIGGAQPMDDLIDLLATLKQPPRPGDVLAHPIVFAQLQRYYRSVLPKASFHHYFWATRVLLGGLLAALTAPLPRARVYHTISTGFAGLVAARARRQTGRPAVITEHGIYLLERQIEVLMADWIGDQVDSGLELDRSVRDLRDLWVRAFSSYGSACYEACDPIIALYGENSAVQRRLGALPERLRVIPNGIDSRRFEALPDQRDPDRPLVALLGRVVPIKDVKTFIRAAAIVHARLPAARFVVLGPTDEDPDYVDECARVVASLGLDEVVRFAGRVAIEDWLPQVDLLVLTSLSEAQPLVILEGGACGIPVVAPDVGSCREMIEGRAAGEAHGGIVTPLVNPVATAEAIAAILTDPVRRADMGAAMRERVRRDYDHDTIIAAYRDLYTRLIA
ncbi:MAG: GT4 family glycosyltransferase PelF [Pseudomonadota bacterium]